MKTVLYLQSSLCRSNRAELSGALRYAKEAGWHLQVVGYGNSFASINPDGREKDVRRKVAELAGFWNPLGFIMECGNTNVLLSPSDFKDLPVVFLDRHPSSLPNSKGVTISSDATAIADAAARELLSLECASYAYAGWIRSTVWSKERRARFEDAMRLNGKLCRFIDCRSKSADVTDIPGLVAAELAQLPKPCGVFTANDFIGEQVLAAAVSAGISVPTELAVIGVDNDETTCENTCPTLSIILPDYEHAGYLSVSMLDRLIKRSRPAPSSEVFGPMAVIRRASTRIWHHRDKRVPAAVELIRHKACEGLRARDVVASMGCSRRLAELRFREATGHSILEEILSIRLECARHLLRRTSMPVAEVARACSYASPESFRKLFIARTGSTPLAFRRQRS